MSREAKFYSGRPVPAGTTLKVYETGPSVIVEGRVPGGPLVVSPVALVNGIMILDDNLFFMHELGPKKVLG